MNFVKNHKNLIIILVIVLIAFGVVIFKLSSKSKNMESISFTPKEQEIKHDLKMYEFVLNSCGACKTVEPIYQQIKMKYSNVLDFEQVNSDYNPNLANKYRVMYMPTFIIVNKEGNVITRKTGIMTNEEMVAFVEEARSIANGSVK
ncbi:MAG: thioredoxin family protein [Clostridia bacterium]